MQFVVLTGSSHGLGAALAERLLSPSRTLICVARSANRELSERARAMGAPFEQRSCDLGDVDATVHLASGIGDTLRAAHAVATRFVLVHDAGIIEPITRIDSLDAQALARNLQVNLVAAMLLGAAFLAATDGSGVERRILNISSGAGRNPVAGWAAYCTAKAGLDMFSRCIAAEQAGRENPARVVSLAPGVLDTGMQLQIRGADQTAFPAVARFRKLKADGELASPQYVAARIARYLDSDTFGKRVIDDIRDYRDPHES